MAFMRHYMMEAGDARPKPVPKRKSAASGPRVKAQRKRVVRTQRKARGKQGGGLDIGGILKGQFGKGVQAMKKGAGQLASRDIAGLIESVTGSVKRPGASFGGGKRRSINPTNVKALRRAMRRFDGFSNLVKRVNKFMPTGAKFTHSKPCAPGKKRGRR